MTRKRIILLVVADGVFSVVTFGGWRGARVRQAWRGIERVEFVTTAVGTQLQW